MCNSKRNNTGKSNKYSMCEETNLGELKMDDKTKRKIEDCIKNAEDGEIVELEILEDGGVKINLHTSHNSEPAFISELKEAAENGNPEAMTEIGHFYIHGKFVDRNPIKGVDYYKRAASLGYRLAQKKLAYAYQIGRGVKQDYSKAVEYYEIALDYKDAGCLTNLAILYFEGLGTNVDYVKSFGLFKCAAEMNIALAQKYLGDQYLLGLGVDANCYEAIKWYEASANQGHNEALFKLGAIYAKGIGLISPNREKAIMYLSLAASQGNEYARRYLWEINR